MCSYPSTTGTDWLDDAYDSDISITWSLSAPDYFYIFKEAEAANDLAKRQQNIEWMRWLWQFSEYLVLVPMLGLVPNRIYARRMLLSYSGWLARKGYKCKKGK